MCSGVQRVKPLPGDPRGRAPLASLAEAEQPHGFFDGAVHGGLPLCETCLTTRKSSGAPKCRHRVVSGPVRGELVSGMLNAVSGGNCVEDGMNELPTLTLGQLTARVQI